MSDLSKLTKKELIEKVEELKKSVERLEQQLGKMRSRYEKSIGEGGVRNPGVR